MATFQSVFAIMLLGPRSEKKTNTFVGTGCPPDISQHESICKSSRQVQVAKHCRCLFDALEFQPGLQYRSCVLLHSPQSRIGTLDKGEFAYDATNPHVICISHKERGGFLRGI